MANLLEETLEKIADYSKTIEDVSWVGSDSGEYAISWEEFRQIADVNYDDGYGSAEIPLGLVVVFEDGSWLERAEYNGAEWWEYKTLPHKQPTTKKFTNVFMLKEDIY